jgi:hypothetical protein
VLDLLGGVVGLLFALLGTTTETARVSQHVLLWRDVMCRVVSLPKHQVKSRLLLDVVVAQGPAVFELLAGKDQALLVGGDAMEVISYWPC